MKYLEMAMNREKKTHSDHLFSTIIYAEMIDTFFPTIKCITITMKMSVKKYGFHG